MSAWDRARHILCVRLDNMGDVLMCTPALRALRSGHPERRLTLLASNAGAALAPYLPEVDDVIACTVPWMKHDTPDDARAVAALAERLRGGRYDGAVIFTSFSQSALPAALLCYLAGIPLRLAHCRENPYCLLTDWVPDPEPEQGIRHEVERQLSLVAHIGCVPDHRGLTFRPGDSDRTAVETKLRARGIALEQPWIMLHPGASAPSRRYPAAHWSALVRLLVRDPGLPLVLSGDAGDRVLADAILATAGPHRGRAVSLAGELDLGQLGAAIASAAVLVSNNTGPAHMAAAVGTPLVDLYALTNPQHTPWQADSIVLFHDVPCRYCYKSVCPQGHHDCLDKVTPVQVQAAVLSLLMR